MSRPSSTATRPRRRFRPRRRTVFALFGLAGLIAFLGVWLWTEGAAARKLRAAEEAADRLDPGWRLADILARRADIPDAENSAFRVRRVLSTLAKNWPLPLVRLDGRAETVLDLVEGVPPGVRLGDAIVAPLQRELSAHAPAVTEARKLAGMDRGRTDPVLQRAIFNTLLGHVQSSRDVCRLLQADASLRAHDGDFDGALESCRAMISVGRSIGDEMFAISQLVRIACVRLALMTAERVLALGEASDPALAKLQALLLDEADQPLLLWGLRGERAAIDDLFSKLATGEVHISELNGARRGPQTPTELLASTSGSFVRYNHGLALEVLNAGIEIAKRPPAEQIDLWERWDKSHDNPKSPLARLLSSLSSETSPAFFAFARASLLARVRLQSFAALIAAERHRLAHGRFPATLAAIDPKFLKSIPLDPFTGGPIYYKLGDDGGPVAYSVGPDRTDNGGRLDPRHRDEPDHDSGYRLRPVADRGLPPLSTPLPHDVFQHSQGDPS